MPEPRITRPNPGERALLEETSAGVAITQLPDDPIALRVSIGQPRELVLDGPDSYCVYRGDRARIIRLLRRVLVALEGN